MKNNYFENSSQKQQQQQFISTPCKNDKYDFSDDQILNSNRKVEDAFHSYCQNNLSPINNFPFMGKSHYMTSPIQHNNKSYKNMKNVFSPAVAHNAQYGKYAPIGYNPVHMVPPPHHYHEYNPLQKDEFESEYHPNVPLSHKSAITPAIKQQQPVILLNGKPSNYPSSKLSHFANQNLNENHNNYYVYQSPVFKMTFSNKNQFEKFIDSDFNKVYVDDFQLQSCGSKQILPKPQDSENENRQISYKRVIQFHDENDEEGQDEKQNSEEKNKNKSESSSIINAKNPVKKGDSQNSHKSYNLFEENNNIIQNALFDSQNTQMTFNPYKNSQSSQISDNATTVKKNIDLQIQSQDFIQTAQKPQQQQKRKLFESPQRNDDRDLHTPSTKKKSSQLLTGNQITQLSKKKEDKIEQKKQLKKDKLLQLESEQIQLSTKKAESGNIEQEEEEEENLKNPPVEKSTAEKEDDHDHHYDEEEDRIEKQSNSSENSLVAPYTAQNSSIKPLNHGEDRKICCNCKRTKCLKLYCECFAASRVCEGCTCQGCYNKPEFEAMRKEARQAILERNNSAFDPKIDSQSKLKQLCNEEGIDSEQKVHSKGCNCKKSNCLKKYCECYQLGVKCTKLCKCDNCKNNINHPHSHDEPDSRLNATPSASNIMASSGKVPANSRSQSNQLNLAQNEYSQYNQYNYYYGQENYQPYYYQIPYGGGYYCYNDYYMYNQEELGENSAGAPMIPHYEHPYQYGYEHYNVPQGMPQQNSKSGKKYPHQYPQSAYQYEQLSNRKRGLKQGNIYEEQQQQYYDTYGYPYMPYPEKKRKQASADDKQFEGQAGNKEYNEEMNSNKENGDIQASKLYISPRFKENSQNDFQEEQLHQIKKEENQSNKKEQKNWKTKLENDSHQKQKIKKEEFAEQLKTINEDIEEENNQNAEQIEENQEEESIEEEQQIEAQQQSNIEEDIESEQIQNNPKPKRQPSKREDKKSKKSKKENVSQNVEITKSPHNTRKNQNQKNQEEKPKQQTNQKQSSKKAAATAATPSATKKKEKKSIQQEEVEEKQISTNSKKSNSKKQKNVC